MEKDLIILVADTNMEFAVRGILSRHKSLGIRPISYEILRHSEQDPGCYLRGHELLRLYVHKHEYALLIFDREGCGQEARSRNELEQEVEERLDQVGWRDRSAAIVIDPELEVWVWNNSPHVAAILGWESGIASLQRWLRGEQLWLKDATKPFDPKTTMEAVLRQTNTPRSSALYLKLAEKVSLHRCSDAAFKKLSTTLQKWFAKH